MNREKVRDLREEYGITQVEISRILGCSRSSYSLWEIGKDTIPLVYLIKIANHFMVNIDYLVDLSTDKYDYSFYPEVIDRKLLGEKLKSVRKSKKITQGFISQAINTTQSTISAYEAGKTGITLTFLVSFAKLTNTSLAYLINGQDIIISKAVVNNINVG